MIKQFEKFSPSSYSDYKQTSIGYGTKARPGERSITKEEADKRLREHVRGTQSYLQRQADKYGYNFTPNQVAALTSFMYNLGNASFDQLTNNGKRSIDQIARMMLKYNKADGKVNKGLVNRRRQEQQLFLS